MSAGIPEVSVVMPSFNHERFVGSAVRSVLSQTSGSQDSAPMELIVVDDGSTDRSVEILRRINDPRLRLVVGENRGAHAAFNRGLELARGEKILLINSDDEFLPDRIEQMSRALDEDGVVAAASDLKLIDESGKTIGTKHAWRDLPPWPAPSKGPRLSGLNKPGPALLESNWISTTSNIAFRRSEARVLRFRNLRYCHDWDFFLRLATLGPIRRLQPATVRYRVHDQNTLREGREAGRGWMRFEILWVIVAHAAPLLRRWGSTPDLRRRLWNGLPVFSGPFPGGRSTSTALATALATQLFTLRGDSDDPPRPYLDLLEADHPFRVDWIETLDQMPGP